MLRQLNLNLLIRVLLLLFDRLFVFLTIGLRVEGRHHRLLLDFLLELLDGCLIAGYQLNLLIVHEGRYNALQLNLRLLQVTGCIGLTVVTEDVDDFSMESGVFRAIVSIVGHHRCSWPSFLQLAPTFK